MDLRRFLPTWKSILLAVFAAILLVLAFPDFELSLLAAVALIPLFWAVEREKASPAAAFILGWLFGIVFFFGSCWWLTFAPITYAGFPPLLAYSLLFLVTVLVGLFPAVFALALSVCLRRFGEYGFLAAPFIWVTTEFARYWITGNNWNAIGYSQFTNENILSYAGIGGVALSGFVLVVLNIIYGALVYGFAVVYGGGLRQFCSNILTVKKNQTPPPITIMEDPRRIRLFRKALIGCLVLAALNFAWSLVNQPHVNSMNRAEHSSTIIAVQPNVPMSGLDNFKWAKLRERHVQLAESALGRIGEQRAANPGYPVTVIFPESPMNFQYDEDREFRAFVRDFASRNNVSVLFNAAEPDRTNGKYFNSAVLVDAEGRKTAQYDKIYLMPFGEAVPAPLQNIVPALVGSFSYGSEYDLLPLGDAKAGVMICFESHFGDLSREYVRQGADVIVELTNDGYLGQTPVLRQHLANAVFRAVETERPVLRVTNVGITAYVTESGEVIDPAGTYMEDTRIWPVMRSDGSQTFYVRYGDWFAWLCSLVTIGLLVYGVFRRRQHAV